MKAFIVYGIRTSKTVRVGGRHSPVWTSECVTWGARHGAFAEGGPLRPQVQTEPYESWSVYGAFENTRSIESRATRGVIR